MSNLIVNDLVKKFTTFNLILLFLTSCSLSSPDPVVVKACQDLAETFSQSFPEAKGFQYEEYVSYRKISMQKFNFHSDFYGFGEDYLCLFFNKDIDKLLLVIREIEKDKNYLIKTEGERKYLIYEGKQFYTKFQANEFILLDAGLNEFNTTYTSGDIIWKLSDSIK
ncbi:MAG: hypothetical protein ABJG88_05315 [Litorimonas sp.]